MVANTARWSHLSCARSLRIFAIVSAKQRIVALRQRGAGFGCVRSVSGRGGRSCGHGGFGSCDAVAGPDVAPASATTAVTVAAIPFARVAREVASLLRSRLREERDPVAILDPDPHGDAVRRARRHQRRDVAEVGALEEFAYVVVQLGGHRGGHLRTTHSVSAARPEGTTHTGC